MDFEPLVSFAAHREQSVHTVLLNAEREGLEIYHRHPRSARQCAERDGIAVAYGSKDLPSGELAWRLTAAQVHDLAMGKAIKVGLFKKMPWAAASTAFTGTACPVKCG